MRRRSGTPDWQRSRGLTSIVRQHEIECGFEWVEGYLHVPQGDGASNDVERLKRDAELAAELGFDAAFVDARRWSGRRACAWTVRRGSTRVATWRGSPRPSRLGGRIHEHTTAEEFSDGPLSVMRQRPPDHAAATSCSPRTTRSSVWPAPRAPRSSRPSSRSIQLRRGRDERPRASCPTLLLWDTADPYRYFRVEPHRGYDVVIFGGEDHKTGQASDTSERYARLEQELRRWRPAIELTHRWSGQVIETPDGLPYIGATAEHQYAGTGYAGNGLTFGTLAGMMMADAILGRANPWSDLFDPGRKAVRHGLWDYLKENTNYPYYLIRDRFAGAEGRSLRSVRRGEGKVIERNGGRWRPTANTAGGFTVRSATCTHMGCLVRWNPARGPGTARATGRASRRTAR